jgi:translocation and assembly module TamB
MSCTLKGDIPPLHQGSGRILFEGRKVRIEGFKGQLGYGPLAIGGTIHLPVDGVPEVDATIKGENLLLARSRNLRLRSDVDLSVSGPLDALLAKGKFVVTDALYSQPMDLLAGSAPAADHKLQLFSIREGPLSTLRLDIEIFGDRSFRISNNIVRGHFSPALRLRGTGAVPEPDGSIFFQDVLVKLELTSLKVDHGEVRFAPDDPFAPLVRLAAHTRIQGFDLNVALEGALPDVEVYVQSNPPLPPRDALILLMTGNTPERLQEKGTQGALMLAGTVFGKRLLSKVQGPSDPDEESFLDRFSLDMGRDISRSGEETIEAEFRVARQWYARGERDRYDDYNFGVVWRLRFR